jgi:hypothetical protein
MALPYSVQFMAVQGGGFVYTVPAGKRAIVKCVTAFNGGSASLGCGLSVGGFPVLSFPVPAQSGAERSGLMIVLSSGEQLINVSNAAVYSQVSGYLLSG